MRRRKRTAKTPIYKYFLTDHITIDAMGNFVITCSSAEVITINKIAVVIRRRLKCKTMDLS